MPALASGATYTGTLSGGGTLSFKTVNKNGKIASVKSFGWKSVPTTCDQGAYSYSSTLPFGPCAVITTWPSPTAMDGAEKVVPLPATVEGDQDDDPSSER